MKIKVETLVQKTVSDFALSGVKFFNQVFGEHGDDSFSVDNLRSDVFTIDAADKLTYQVKLSEFIAPFDSEKIVLVHVYCNLLVENPTQSITPIRFNVTFNGNILGAMSQFSVINAKDLNFNDIVIDKFDIPDNSYASLTILVGYIN